jgi:hypothetical protein
MHFLVIEAPIGVADAQRLSSGLGGSALKADEDFGGGNHGPLIAEAVAYHQLRWPLA